MYILRFGLSLIVLTATELVTLGQSVSTPYGTSYQVNVNAAGQNIPGDAANEPSLCIDSTNPSRIAVGWRQFSSVASAFRQAGWAYSTNGGMNWTFPGVLEGAFFRSDPVLASDADGRFYYLGVLTNSPLGEVYHCDLYRSTNGGKDWQPMGLAEGGDKEWMTIDTTSGKGRGNIYQTWSPFYNYDNDFNRIFSRSTNGGQTWMNPVAVPVYTPFQQPPYFGTVDVGPNGEVYMVGTVEAGFLVNRSTNAANPAATPAFDSSTLVDLGGDLIFGAPGVNPDGLLGQAWIAVDRSSSSTRSNVYVLCTVDARASGATDPADVMFSRSTDGGQTWSAPKRINDDIPTGQTYHWFGTIAVSPSGRIDVCWYDTRKDPTSASSELYYSFSVDGGITWSTNIAVSPSFNHSLGYPGTPPQQKIGDYLGMISLDSAPCIAYAATFNGEEDVFFLRIQLPITLSATRIANTLRLTWTALPGATYCVQSKPSLHLPWSAATTLGCPVASGMTATFDDPLAPGTAQRFYRVIPQP